MSDEPVMVAETLSYARVGESVWPLLIGGLHVLHSGMALYAIVGGGGDERFGFDLIFGRWARLAAGVLQFSEGVAGAVLSIGAIVALRRWDARRVIAFAAVALAAVGLVDFALHLVAIWSSMGQGVSVVADQPRWLLSVTLFYVQHLAFPLALAVVLSLSCRDQGAAGAFD